MLAAFGKLLALARAFLLAFDAVFLPLVVGFLSHLHVSRSCTLCTLFLNINRAFCAREYVALSWVV